MNQRRFTTTKVEHPDCPRCIECIESAEIHAAVTGSVGATFSNDRTLVGGHLHSATVVRVKS